MRKSIQIAIEKPCSENFSNFRKTRDGGYCGSCRKEVIDFTRLTDQEIFNYFSTTSGNTCGRFRTEQLGVITVAKTVRPQRLSLIAAAIGLISFFKPLTSGAKPRLSQQPSIELHPAAPVVEQLVLDSIAYTLKGRVMETDGETGITGATVMLKGTDNGTVTDTDGNFLLQITRPANSKVILQAKFIGYLSQEREITLTSQKTESFDIVMLLDSAVLGEMVIVGGVVAVRRWSPRGIWYRIKNVFR